MISVIIPTRNRLGPLQRCLRSLRRQELKDLEVVLVNDAGASPRSVVDGWKGELVINLIELQEQRGVSAARNIGIEAAQGNHVAFLDDDDIFLPHHLSSAEKALSEMEGPTLVYGNALVSEHWLEALPRDTQGMPHKGHPFDPRFLMVANPLHTGSIVATNFSDLSTRFDEELDHCEDWEMWLALCSAFHGRFLGLGEVTSVYHQVGSFDGTVTLAYQQTPTAFTLARARVYEKWPTDDPLVLVYRDWLRTFDLRLDSLIGEGQPLPRHAFDQALAAMKPAFANALPPSEDWLDDIFIAATTPTR